MKRALLILIISIVNNSYGQIECYQEKLHGKWEMINKFYWGVNHNIDSLKSISIINKSDENCVIEFINDSTNVVNCKLKNRNKTIKGYQSLDMKNCELKISRKKNKLKDSKYQEKINWKIIFIDNEIIVFTEDNNPKGIATHVLIKK